MSFQVKEIKNASPSIKEIKYLIDTWLSNKANYMAGTSEIDISGIVKDGLIKRTIDERQKDIKKGVYKLISSEIEEIVLIWMPLGNDSKPLFIHIVLALDKVGVAPVGPRGRGIVNV